MATPLDLNEPLASSPRRAKVRFCIASELARLAERGRLVMLTFTFPDKPGLSEAKKRVGDFLRQDWSTRWVGLTVAEQHASGAWHIHAAGLIRGREWDGHWSRTRAGWRYYGGPADLHFWEGLRAAVARHGIGRVQCVPVREGTHEFAARYVAKYLTKDRRTKGRLVEFQMRRRWHREEGLHRRTSSDFAFLTNRRAFWGIGCAVVFALRMALPDVDAVIRAHSGKGTGLGWVWPLRHLVAAAARGRIGPPGPGFFFAASSSPWKAPSRTT